MRKILSLILCCGIIFCSCSPKNSAGLKSKITENPFSCTAEINYSGEILEAELVYRNSANASIKIVEPSSVAGLCFELHDGEFTANYMDLSFPIEKLGGSAVSMAELIFSALRKSEVSNEFSRDAKTGELYLGSEVGSKKYLLTLDQKSGAPRRFKVYDMDFEVEFKNFRNLE